MRTLPSSTRWLNWRAKRNKPFMRWRMRRRVSSIRLPGTDLWVKREDVSPIHSYKWRGAFFKMHELARSGYAGEFVAASAGNHAQGVAISAAPIEPTRDHLHAAHDSAAQTGRSQTTRRSIRLDFD